MSSVKRLRQAQSLLDVLLQRGLITPEELSRLNRAQAEGGDTAVRVLERMGFVDPRILATEISQHFGIPLLEDGEWPSTILLADRISPRFMRDHRVLPLRIDSGVLTVVVSDPEDTATLSALRIASERHIELRVATVGEIVSRIEQLLKGFEDSADAASGSGATEINEEDVDHIKDLALEAPVIDFVDRSFREAATARATDLHVEPGRGRVTIRRRIDGILYEAGTLAPDFGKAVVSRIKILSHLNIAERRLPQDGRARLRIDERDYDVRVATMPTIHGEGVAVRFLSGIHQVPELDKLGLSQRDERLLRSVSGLSHGLIVVTGPTGSGKTTTLAAVLSLLNDRARKIVTIEDPVEYQIEGINQIQVKADIGLTFAHTLRSLLRFDPDIMMVGEMRDSETARIGIHASLTGHLVLTTLHTNSAPSAVTRLLDLDVEAYLIASTLRCVLAQRLVRRLCSTCREEYFEFPEPLAMAMPEASREARRPMRLWRAKGCDRCNQTGYHGRAAIFELLAVDEDIQKLIRPGVNSGAIATAAKQAGMTTMIADGLAKCESGVTTVAEVSRVALEM
jgi:general secretion pathway protein E